MLKTAAGALFGLVLVFGLAGSTVLAQAPASPTLALKTDGPTRVHFVDAQWTDVLDWLARTGGISIRVASDIKDFPKSTKTIDVQGASFEEVLSKLLGPLNFTYKVVDENTVEIIKPAI